MLLNASSPSAASQATNAPPAATLAYCQVKTTDILNLRASPGGTVIGAVAFNATLRATEKKAGWYKVQVVGITGWISADYVTASGDCD